MDLYKISTKDKRPATWIERLARLGFTAKGIVYGIVGILAVQAAFNLGGQTTDLSGALAEIATQPFGKFLLSLVGIGLVGYVLWRFVQAIKDPEHQGEETGAGDIARRLGYAINGLIYGGLAFTAFKLVIGSGSSSGSGESSAQNWAARIMAQPFGRWLIGTAGAFLIGLCFYYFYRAIKATFRKHLKLSEMSPTEEKWAMRAGRFGIAARGVVFLIIGGFLIQAARLSDPSRVRASEGALRALEQSPLGPWLLGLVALGLVAYGIYMGVMARYCRISMD